MSRHATRLVYNTLWVADSFRNSGIPNSRGILVRPPCDPEKYLVASERRYCTLVNLTDGKTQKYSKGPGMFYELAKRFPEEQFLGVLGAYGHQDVREDYPNVTFMENTADAREFYSKTKIVLSPSNYESYGRISVEAAISGIPSITSTAPGFTEHGIAASMVDYRDCGGWEAALRELQNPEVYALESKRAQTKAFALWERSEQELEDFVRMCHVTATTQRKPPRRR
jgi:glycosyltransferase involved in cell wall biosynthesis